ncbi:MAG TPA: CesT family type III secretion system chaperone [Noviherbaspirillum sp.]|jgi:hypothetical protein|uniref:CesT family type III secretion system chaperone n=1 Tax=Noviherbaspirillum sp. TaxID=1926288 RepID=UPI002F93847C
MKEQYISLVRDLCRLCELKNPEVVIDSGAMMVNDVVISLAHNATVDPGVLFIYCDFGKVPEGREVEAYSAMLKTNLLLYNGRGPAFAMSFETGRVVFADHCRMADIDPKALRDKLAGLAEKAHEWRALYALETGESGERVEGEA